MTEARILTALPPLILCGAILVVAVLLLVEARRNGRR